MSGAVAAGRPQAVSLGDKVEFLSRPAAYPDATSGVRCIETHMSWVFVCDRFVYKLKKPVRLPFLDFSTLGRRRWSCEESLRLKRRLAASVYLRVLPLTVEGGRLQLDGGGEVVEWLEQMRRLPEDRMLDRVIARRAVRADDVRRVAAVLARFYRDAALEAIAADAFVERLHHRIEDFEQALSDRALGLDGVLVQGACAGQRRFVDSSRALFEARLTAGRVVEAHGDLRPEHVVLLDDPVVIDCLEFNRDLRVMDVADELSYLAMECAFAGAPLVGPLVFETYGSVTGDCVPSSLIAFYQSFRALLRAKLCVGHLPDYPTATHPQWLGLAGRYLAMAGHTLPRP